MVRVQLLSTLTNNVCHEIDGEYWNYGDGIAESTYCQKSNTRWFRRLVNDESNVWIYGLCEEHAKEAEEDSGFESYNKEISLEEVRIYQVMYG